MTIKKYPARYTDYSLHAAIQWSFEQNEARQIKMKRNILKDTGAKKEETILPVSS